MEFQTAYNHEFIDREKVYPTYKPEYRMELNQETGQEELVEVGRVNLQEIMNEAAKDCCIYNQIDRMERTGDVSWLGQSVESFIDCTKLPSTYMDLLNVKAKASQLWAQIPISERDKYGNNMALFMKDLDKKVADKVATLKAEARKKVKEGDLENA